MEQSLSRTRRTHLLDLPDALLLEILSRVNDLGSIIRFGSASRCLKTLHFRVARLEVNEEAGAGEGRLLRFLTSLAQRGGYLRELVVCLRSESDDHPVDSLDWILPVANNLHTLELCFLSDRTRGGIDFPELDTISRCTMLVKLVVDGNNIAILSRHIELVLASCTRLRVLAIFHVDADGDLMRLRSFSLQQVKLAGVEGLSVALETPALNELTITTGVLNICSHALKKLSIKLNDLPTGSRIRRISPPLVNLEFLSLDCMLLREMREVLASVQGGCVDVLHVNAYSMQHVNLASFLQPLTRVRSLKIPQAFMRSFAKSRMRNEAQTLTRLGVEELIVEVAASGTTENDYRHVDELMLVLRGFLSSELLRELVIQVWVYGEDGCRAALKAGVESLRDEFPGVVSVSLR